MSVSGDTEHQEPPPASQSHFAKFEDFTPDEDACFDQEFARLASSQDWVPGSQQYARERTVAMREEIKLHYFSTPQQADEPGRELTDEKLEGYQALCREVGLEPGDSVPECRRRLKKTLVNIVELIDARRKPREGKVKVWDDFEELRAFTLLAENRISMVVAKEDGGFLTALLQRLRGERRGPRKRARPSRIPAANSRVLMGRVAKRSPS